MARLLEPEVMDDPSLDPAAHRDALAGLHRLNKLSGAARQVHGAIRSLWEAGPQPVRVLDVACGGGDVAIDVWGRARREGKQVEVHGCDISDLALGVAGERAKFAGTAVEFFRLNALRDPLPAGYDVVTCSLFLHHLSDDDAIVLLRKMGEAAGKRVVVNDLARSRLNLAGVWLATRLVARSPVVRNDGPASVRAAFTMDEARALAQRAGLAGAKVRPAFPSRYLLTWDKR